MSARGVFVVEGLEQGADEWAQVGSILDMQGAVPHMAPKRRSHVARGLSHSARDHWALTVAVRVARDLPVRGPVALEKCLGEKLPFVVGKQSEERVGPMSAELAESDPTTPDSVSILMSRFGATPKDDAAISSACVTKERISLGN